ncbi:MAG: hypothetical protein ABIZ05_08395 [Pseudonocardiaceae bacterium]
MSDAVSFAELDGQHGELLAPRTVLSLVPQAAQGGPVGFVNSVLAFFHSSTTILQGNSVGAAGTPANGA